MMMLPSRPWGELNTLYPLILIYLYRSLTGPGSLPELKAKENTQICINKIWQKRLFCCTWWDWENTWRRTHDGLMELEKGAGQTTCTLVLESLFAARFVQGNEKCRTTTTLWHTEKMIKHLDKSPVCSLCVLLTRLVYVEQLRPYYWKTIVFIGGVISPRQQWPQGGKQRKASIQPWRGGEDMSNPPMLVMVGWAGIGNTPVVAWLRV